MHQTIKDALLAKVEDPAAGGGSMAPLLAAIDAHGDASLRALRDEGPAPPPVPGESPLDALGRHAFAAAQRPNAESLAWIAVHTLRVAFIVPEATLAVWERFADGWLRGKASDAHGTPPPAFDAVADRAALPLVSRPGRLPDGLPELLWRVVGQQVDPATITPTIAAFGATYGAALKDACARAILMYPAQADIARQAWPPRVDIDALAGHPPDTLGHAYYHLIVDNGFDPEVLDPETVTGFHPGLDGTNRRILQQHELWHLVAGYSTSPLHESAISAFQLAQFGHNYSAAFLATIITMLLFSTPVFLDPFLQVSAEAWRHGRATPPMMPIDWPAQWGKSLDAIRAEFGIAPFVSTIPDLMA